VRSYWVHPSSEEVKNQFSGKKRLENALCSSQLKIEVLTLKASPCKATDLIKERDSQARLNIDVGE
jgi:hypothetical protein